MVERHLNQQQKFVDSTALEIPGIVPVELYIFQSHIFTTLIFIALRCACSWNCGDPASSSYMQLAAPACLHPPYLRLINTAIIPALLAFHMNC
jgi:hypothetical protein